MAHSVAGRSVVVTGGSRGIGKGIARVFAGAGAKVAILSRNRGEGAATAAEIGGGAIAVAGDVTDESALRTAFSGGGGGVRRGRRALRQRRDLPAEHARGHERRAMGPRLRHQPQGDVPVGEGGAAVLKKTGQGRIVITSSITGPVTGYPGWTHYGATKAGQLGFMRTACIELAKYGITVNAVMPGNIRTEGLAGLGAEYEASMAASIPLKRLGSVEDVGNPPPTSPRARPATSLARPSSSTAARSCRSRSRLSPRRDCGMPAGRRSRKLPFG